MKAALIDAHGAPDVLRYGDVADPVAGPNEVLVDIQAASVNGADWKVRSGASGPVAAFPYILGRDFSGRIAAAGDQVTDLQVGDPVFAVCDVGQEGAYAEKIAIKAALCARKSDRLTHVESAALALIGLPPANGFFSKLLIAAAAVEGGRIDLATIVSLGAVLSALYFVRLLHVLYSPGTTEVNSQAPDSSPSRPAYVVAGLFAVLCLVVGVLTPTVVPHLQKAATQLLDQAHYVAIAGR